MVMMMMMLMMQEVDNVKRLQEEMRRTILDANNQIALVTNSQRRCYDDKIYNVIDSLTSDVDSRNSAGSMNRGAVLMSSPSGATR